MQQSEIQPLEGLTVLDFTTLLPGPLATLMLAEAGARVIKLERPGGEDMRSFPPFVKGKPVLFEQLNRGKECLELDLKDEAARGRVLELLQTADILVEQFRPGVMDRLGLGYDTLSARFPGLIYCSITGFGQEGPRASSAGHDLNYMALSGLLAQSCGSAKHPVLPPAQIADIGGGSFPALTNILLAILKRTKTGKGCHIDISMTDSMFTFGIFAHAFHAAGKPVPDWGQGLLCGGSPRYRLYPAGDGRLIAVAALEEKFWQGLCDLLEIEPGLRNDRADPEASAAAIARALAAKPSSDWKDLLSAADCCACVVATMEEARQDPAIAARDLFSHQLDVGGEAIEALPLPLASHFRKQP
ncbi:CaiB/BaiF CoA transferase family protein [Roseibium suaedae]|uniref:Crotonobetainyl-CoA:carnitine CoA-transferase CaiB n=1 Tax=Roseibium suaedae TaxID=735517 RepID=A0A1M7PNS8_9HYPH|nr:CoA transferase [Roseibium suaedae]SHN18935.1 Crotonobetainyl-CoA:carnitine CoA-transferase CaiB [Roseibium suaedae]